MDVGGDPPPRELRDLDSLSSVRAFFQGSLTRADLATAAGYPVQGSGSEATVETVRGAEKTPLALSDSLDGARTL